jgi:NADH-quinone oxidoreductase subunit J
MILLGFIDWYAFFFLLFALITCSFAVAVVLTNNIVRMAFYLTLSLGAAAGLFILAGAQFVGAMQLMIYVGGTLVLLIFGVMLTAQHRFVSLRAAKSEWILSVMAGTALLVLLVVTAFRVDAWRTARPAEDLTVADAQTATAIGAALAGVRVDQLNETDPVQRAGMSGYLLPFVIVSVHLLVVLVGAAYLARAKRPTDHLSPNSSTASPPET